MAFSLNESSFVSAKEKWLRRERVKPFVGAAVDFVVSALLEITSATDRHNLNNSS